MQIGLAYTPLVHTFLLASKAAVHRDSGDKTLEREHLGSADRYHGKSGHDPQ